MSKVLTKIEYKKLSLKLNKLKEKKKQIENALHPKNVVLQQIDTNKQLTILYKTISVLYSVNGDQTDLISSLKEMAESLEKLGKS